MKIIIVFFSVIILYLHIDIHAQDIEAKLSTSDSTLAFNIIDNDGKTILSAMGSGSVGIGTSNSFNLFEVKSNLFLEDQYGRGIFLNAEGYYSGPEGKAGDIFLRCGNTLLATDFVEGAKIDLYGAYGEPFGAGFGGNIDIIAGGAVDIGGDINIMAGQGEEAGDINIISGYGRSMGGGIAGTILLQTGPDGWDHNLGDIIVNSSGDINLTPEYQSESGGKVVVNGSGTYSGTWSQVADKRFAAKMKEIENASNNIIQLNGVIHSWNYSKYPDKQFPNKEQYGLIAQDVEKVVPLLVEVDKEGNKSIDYSKITVLLIEAFKEQQKKIEDLTSRINELESK
ncbi:MAG: tail fiber domain-containing protein [Ignavibacteriae bacterium]|nr:tail fiber domain-containing protein [Ignavibacteriota bacterium]NOG99553.1 tail fiber domain-containing protein [Ignavibacteriota bacterium]